MARTSQSLPPLETVTITGLAYGGDGMAYDENGGTVFVPYGLPGDTVRVQVDNKSSSKGGGQVPKKWGKIVDVITPSPDRLEKPPCTHCFDCGGCALQHMQMQAYQDWKYNAVVDRLAKVGLVPERAHPLISIPAKSRRRATFAVARMGRRVVLGFNRHHSDQIVDLNECHVVVEPIINVLPGIRALMDVLLQNVRAADVSVAVLDYGLDVLVTGNIELDLMMREAIAEFVQTYHIARFSMRSSERAEAEVILAPKSAAVTVGGVPFVIPPGAFLQPSRAGEAALIDCVCQGVGDAAQVADLFCGMGTFSYPLGAVGKSVVGYDVSTLSPLPFRGRAGWGTNDESPLSRPSPRARGEGEIEFCSRNLYREPVTAKELSAFEAVVFDPPRAGAKAQAPEIAGSGVSRIVAVSCNPTTFIGDCGPFLAEGYRFADLWVVDQFTWSFHVEVVGVFVRGE